MQNTMLAPVALGGIYRMPLAATALEIVSTSVDDSPTGSGARVVRIFGISDWDGPEITQDVAFNGLSAVAVPISMFRVYRMLVIQSGTYADTDNASHNSTLSLQESGGGDVWAVIDSINGRGLGQTAISFYSIPRGITAYPLSVHIWIESVQTANVLFRVRQGADKVTPPFFGFVTGASLRNIEGAISFNPKGPAGVIEGPADFGFFAAATIGNASISADIEIMEVQDRVV